jgi:SAM-dependent methyltransferase
VLVEPYSALARDYDDIMGRRFFANLRGAFERLVARHRIAFSSAADLGCGTGLFARYLNLLWRVPVFGVDRSPAMLRRAAINCGGTRVVLLRQDIRRLLLPRAVDLVTANYDTVNHLTEPGDLGQLFRRVFGQLKPGGHFVFDFLTTCQPPRLTVHYRRRGGCISQRMRWLPRRSTLLYDVTFVEPGGRCMRREKHRERAYRPAEVARALMDAGFVLREVLDAETLARPRGCPGRVWVIAKKP